MSNGLYSEICYDLYVELRQHDQWKLFSNGSLWIFSKKFVLQLRREKITSLIHLKIWITWRLIRCEINLNLYFQPLSHSFANFMSKIQAAELVRAPTRLKRFIKACFIKINKNSFHTALTGFISLACKGERRLRNRGEAQCFFYFENWIIMLNMNL